MLCNYCKKLISNPKRPKFCSNKCKENYHTFEKRDKTYKQNLRKTCKFCEKTFKPINVQSNFCSPKCRQYWFYYKNSKKKVNPSFSHKKSLHLGNKIRKEYVLTKEQKQICYGSMMGDGGIHFRKSGQCRLMFGHGIAQKEYLIWKKNLLSPFVLPNNFSIRINKGYKPGSKLCSTCSIVHQDFLEIGNLFYRKIGKKRKKIITRKVLNLIESLGLLIWYLDDGSLSKDKIIKLSTHGFSLSENKTIKIWLWQKYRIKATIRAENSHDKQYFYLILSASSSRKFFEITKKYHSKIPKCIRYKIVK